MRRFSYILVIVLICSLSLIVIRCAKSSTLNNRQLIGTWVGTYIKYDEKIPSPRIVTLNPDGSYTVKIFEQSEFESNWHIEGDSLVLDTVKLDIQQAAPDELIINGKWKTYYRRAIDKKITVTDAQIENTAWESTDPENPVKVFLNYEKMITQHPDGSLEIRCWKLKSDTGLQFFYQIGNQFRCNKITSRLQQIISLNDTEWGLQNFNIISEGTTTFRKIEYSEAVFQQLLNTKQFQRCSQYNLFNCGNLANYNDKPGLVKERYLKRFKPVPGNSQSGVLRLKFLVNCAAETGNYEFEGMNTQYKAQEFDKRIQQQIIEITSNMEGWIPYEHDDRQDFDCFANFIFKLKNGKIVDLSL